MEISEILTIVFGSMATLLSLAIGGWKLTTTGKFRKYLSDKQNKKLLEKLAADTFKLGKEMVRKADATEKVKIVKEINKTLSKIVDTVDKANKDKPDGNKTTG